MSKEKQIKNSILYLLPVILSNLLPLLTLPIFTRILTKEDYGVWALAQVYAIFVNGIANFGLTVGYERNFFEYKEGKKVAGLLYSTLSFVLVSFFIFGTFTWIFKNSLAEWIIGSHDHASILFLSYCTVSIVGLKNYYLTYYKNTENAKSFVWYSIDESLLGVLFSFYMVVFMRIGIIGLVWGQLLASLIIFILLSFKISKTMPVCFDKNALKDSLQLSWPLTPRIFFGIIGSQFDKYMIGLLNTVGGVGVYSIGQKVANTIFVFMTAIQNVYSPQVYRRMFEMGEDGKAAIGKYLTPFLYVSIFIGLLVAHFSEEMIWILTPESYHEATNIIIVLSMLYVTYFFGKQPQLVFAKKTHLVSLLTLISIGLNVAINIPFIYKWGAIGAAWGTLVAGLISGAISFIVSQRHYRIIWEYQKIGLMLLMFFSSAIIILCLRNFEVYYGIKLIVKIISVVMFLYIGKHFSILSRVNCILIKKALVG
ncbi:MAG: oligosaccharide flippase family protein [Dissulfurispiraceae bacterium]|jgi:O-antigen/teichoic acid export membrane protein|nr:oligosaccharide flippase family protein [Dissulfurispiraceae bacterium]